MIKVEPPGGEAMRGAAYAIAACQRGKRSLAMDIAAADARPVVERLIAWADVVLHNFRVGVSERLGIDEASVARLNPRAVYCHASAFGSTGPRARAPGNDALMQALTGVERAIGGAGNDPIAATWIPVDMVGGWVAATGILAGLYARAVTGRGQQVATSLLGAGMLFHSGVFRRDGQVVRGPELDAGQTGYGPGYRIYRAGDGGWVALVRARPGRLAAPAVATGGGGAARDVRPPARRPRRRDRPAAEAVLEAALATAGGGRVGGPAAGPRPAGRAGRGRWTATPSAGPSSTTRSTGSSGGWRPTRRPTGATSSRSARCCAAAPPCAPPRPRCSRASASTRSPSSATWASTGRDRRPPHGQGRPPGLSRFRRRGPLTGPADPRGEAMGSMCGEVRGDGFRIRNRGLILGPAEPVASGRWNPSPRAEPRRRRAR